MQFWKGQTDVNAGSILKGRRQERTAGVEDMGYPSMSSGLTVLHFPGFCMYKIIKAKKSYWHNWEQTFSYKHQCSSCWKVYKTEMFIWEGVIHHEKKELHLQFFWLLRLFLHAFYIDCSDGSWMCSMSTPFCMKKSILSVKWVFHPSRVEHSVEYVWLLFSVRCKS